jgi:signal transduction histidine kinase
VLSDVEHDIHTLAEAKKHTLRFILPEEEVFVFADHIRLGMALTNVIHNAIRFTPDGGEITVACEVRSGNVFISIADNGIGLTEDQVDMIFEKFYQVEDHMTRKHGGLGIGLSITKALVEAHGGRIWASSPGLHQGATFTIALPLAT